VNGVDDAIVAIQERFNVNRPSLWGVHFICCAHTALHFQRRPYGINVPLSKGTIRRSRVSHWPNTLNHLDRFVKVRSKSFKNHENCGGCDGAILPRPAVDQNVFLGLPRLLKKSHDRVPLPARIDGFTGLIVADENSIANPTVVLGSPLVMRQVPGGAVDNVRNVLRSQHRPLGGHELTHPDRGTSLGRHTMQRMVSCTLLCHGHLVDIHHRSHCDKNVSNKVNAAKSIQKEFPDRVLIQLVRSPSILKRAPYQSN
jgi:hypothetical protein